LLQNIKFGKSSACFFLDPRRRWATEMTGPGEKAVVVAGEGDEETAPVPLGVNGANMLNVVPSLTKRRTLGMRYRWTRRFVTFKRGSAMSTPVIEPEKGGFLLATTIRVSLFSVHACLKDDDCDCISSFSTRRFRDEVGLLFVYDSVGGANRDIIGNIEY
jgi:hypothetical protein